MINTELVTYLEAAEFIYSLYEDAKVFSYIEIESTDQLKTIFLMASNALMEKHNNLTN